MCLYIAYEIVNFPCTCLCIYHDVYASIHCIWYCTIHMYMYVSLYVCAYIMSMKLYISQRFIGICVNIPYMRMCAFNTLWYKTQTYICMFANTCTYERTCSYTRCLTISDIHTHTHTYSYIKHMHAKKITCWTIQPHTDTHTYTHTGT
jgi:hypothetical protein